MKSEEIGALMRGVATVVKEHVGALASSVYARLADVEKRLAVLPSTAEKGEPGEPGPAGTSAFDLARAAGFTGTESDWLASLHGRDGESVQGERGEDGKSITLDDVGPLVKQAVAEALLSDDAHTLVGSALQSLTEAISERFAGAEHAG